MLIRNLINIKDKTAVLLALIVFIANLYNEWSESDNKKVYLLKIEKEISDSLYLYLNKTLKKVIEEKKNYKGEIYLIIEFDTPGGALAATFNIVKLFDKVADDGIITIAYINTQALSAGAIISLSCKKLYMVSGSNIGSAAPILISPFGLVELGEYKEKIVSAIRSLMTSRAQKYGRPPLLLQKMVDESFDIYKVTFENGEISYMKDYEIANAEQQGKYVKEKILVRPKGELLNLTDKEAVEFGIAQGIVKSIEDILVIERINKKPSEIGELKKGVEDYFVELLESGIIASILSMIGLGALFTFFKTGSLTALIIAIICLSFTPLVKAIVGLSGPVALYLILLGIGLVLVELLVIPGTTIVGILGVISIIVGIAMNFIQITPPEIPRIVGFSSKVFSYTTLTLVGALLLFLGAIKLIPSVPVVKKIVLEGALQEKAVDTIQAFKIEKGTEGVTISECKPIGLVDFNGKIIECEAVGEFIKRNKKVVVIDVSGNKVYVKLKSERDNV